MRKLLALLAVVLVAPAALGFGPPAMIESDQAQAPLVAEQVVAIQRFEAPTVSARNAAVVDGPSGTILYAKDATSRRAMASLTKMMTALLALEQGDLDQRVQVTVDSSQLGDSSVMGLRPGEELTLGDLLYGLLLTSGNDAALAIAQTIRGSVPQFVALMNEKAASLGLRDTHFANPHGLDAPDHYSSAANLLQLARTAYANPIFATIVATKEYTVVGKLATYRLPNTNELLGAYAGLDGIKTGTTDAAGECFVGTAQRDGDRLFSVVLDSSARFTDTLKILDYSFENFRCQRLSPPASPYYELPPGPADEAAEALTPTNRLMIDQGPWDCRPVWQLPWLRYEATFPDSWDGEQAGGTITFFAGDVLIDRVAVQDR